jgi:hypothetical protein
MKSVSNILKQDYQENKISSTKKNAIKRLVPFSENEEAILEEQETSNIN